MSKKIWIPLVSIASALVITVIVMLIMWFGVWKIDLKIKVQQIDEQQELQVSWETSRKVSKVTVEVYHGNETVSAKTITNKAELERGLTNIYAYYGKHEIKVTVWDDGIYNISTKTNASLFASEYNIAPITASMPVTMFSLNLNNITVKDGKDIPTFAWFKRSGAWDWNNLPKNVYAMPVAKMDEFYNSDEKVMYAKTSTWVKELYEINKESKFNFYYNDYYAYGWLKATVANGIPAENYHVTLLSDGTGSFHYFNKRFNNANPQAEYDKMKSNYEVLKKQVANTKNYKENSGKYKISTDTLREYAYVMANEESNVDWWLTRVSGTLISTDEFYKSVENNQSVKVKDLKTMLNALNEDQKIELKQLYKFSDTMFEKAEIENKEAMVILGTWTEDEHNFIDYVNAVKSYYGDEYVYYYKGHPRNPTNAVPGKLERLNNLGLIDVDATIAAELIMFFNPDIFLSGYQTTVFVSATDEKCSSLFNVSKSNAQNNPELSTYRDSIDYFITPITKSSPVYGSIVPNDNKKYYVMEFNNIEKHEVAIFNASEKTIKYYKLNTNSNAYEEVAK